MRGRFARNVHSAKDDGAGETRSDTPAGKKRFKDTEDGHTRNKDGLAGDGSDDSGTENPSVVPEKGPTTLLDGDFLESTNGRPMPMTDRGNAVFQMSILNDTLFLSIINVLDYSILVGVDEENRELVVGIIDFMRQYDILKQMERVGKSLPMVVGSEAPTIIQPPLYKARFTNAMERYFMSIPEAASLILEASTMGKGGEIFILDMGKPVKIVDLAKHMITLAGMRLDDDIKIEYTGLRPGEKACVISSTGVKIIRTFRVKPVYEEFQSFFT